jgi:predicted acyl esterase
MLPSTIINCEPSIRNEYPYIVEKLSSITIVLDDGVKLAATIWMPISCILH